MFLWLFALGAVLVVIAVAGREGHLTGPVTPPPARPSAAEAPGVAEGRNVKLVTFGWRKGGFDTVMIATFTISNNNAFAIKDIYVACALSARSGTEIGYTATTIYEKVPAHGRKTVREVNMGSGISLDFSQVASAYCKLGSFDKAD